MGLTATIHDNLELVFPVGTEHLISLINNHVLEAAQREALWLVGDEINKATWGSNENITALGDLVELVAAGATTIHNTWTKHRAVAEATRLVEDLHGKLTVGTNDEHEWLGTRKVARIWDESRRVGAWRTQLLGLAHELGQGGDQKGTSLAGAWEGLLDCV